MPSALLHEKSPTLDRKGTNKVTTQIGFAGIVTAVAAWSIWGGDMFPAEKDPTGGMS